jgi:tetratricopeptide (TPR) repeat protein
MKRHLCLFATALGMCFFVLNTTAHAQQVKADTGGVAIGRDVIQSTIIIGIPQEKVDELVRDAKSSLEELTVQQRENITLLKEKLDLNLGQVRTALAILGENDIPPERLAAKLVEIAERFKDLQATASPQPGDDPKIAALKADAQKAIEVGELARADALLANAETEQRRALDRLALNAAETSARRGEIALTRLRYREAATHFANAATVFSPNSPYEDKRVSYLQKEASALYQQGYELGDNGALLSAIKRRKRLLELIPRERVPLEWARTQSNLGRALWRLGERDSGTAKLEEAVAAFREALKELTPERVPLEWARTQGNLAITFARLGERESGTAKLEEAVIAYREALAEWTRERVPLQWATSFGNQGIALLLIAERRGDTGMAETALSQVNTAYDMMRDGGHVPFATFYEQQLSRARAIVVRLRGR